MNAGFISKSQLPSLLSTLMDSPDGLYYKGEISANLFDRCLGIVGSRRNTRYANEVLDVVLPGLIANSVTVVSGFMYGVDCEAHSKCIAIGGITIAVLPYGIDFGPPNDLLPLYNSILDKGGLIVSEYPSVHPPEKWTFVARNRIVAGLSHGVLVVEAAKKSGALITAQKATQYARKVFAIPGSITSSVSLGTNNLIKGGAKLVSSCTDILDTFGWGSVLEMAFVSDSNSKGLRSGSFDAKEVNLFKILEKNPGCSYEDLLGFSELKDLSELQLITVLTKLQISGYAVEDGGRFYVNKS